MPLIRLDRSPTKPELVPFKRRNKPIFTALQTMPEIGPNINAAIRDGKSEILSFKKGADGNSGNSKSNSTVAIAASIPIFAR